LHVFATNLQLFLFFFGMLAIWYKASVAEVFGTSNCERNGSPPVHSRCLVGAALEFRLLLHVAFWLTVDLKVGIVHLDC